MILFISSLIQVLYKDVYMLDENMKWHTLPPMPKANSHIECSWVLVNNSIVILGGTTENHPINKRMMLVGEVFRFDLVSQVFIQFFPFFLHFENRKEVHFGFLLLSFPVDSLFIIGSLTFLSF